MTGPSLEVKFAELSTKFDQMLETQQEMSGLLASLDKDKQEIEKQLIKLSDKIDNLQQCSYTIPDQRALSSRVDRIEKWFIRAAWSFALTLVAGILSWLGVKIGR